MDIPPRFNIGAELIERNLRAGRGDEPALWSGGKVLSYRELGALVDRVASALLRAGIEPALGERNALPRLLVAGETGERSLERWIAETPAQSVETAPTTRDEPAFWLWTSGSTGRPKAAVHAHQDWPHCCELYGGAILE